MEFLKYVYLNNSSLCQKQNFTLYVSNQDIYMGKRIFNYEK